MTSSTMSRPRAARIDRLAGRVERALRVLGDPRLGVVVLALTAIANLVTAAQPEWRRLLDWPPYVALIGVLVLTGIASVAVRIPSVWREWRRPSPLPERSATPSWQWQLTQPLSDDQFEGIGLACRRAGYRLASRGGPGRHALAGTKRGWSRFAALGSHLAVVVLVAGAGLGTALAEETRFGLFPGDQSLLVAPRAGVTSALRFDKLDARFDAAGQPLRFDTHVTFIRDGRAIRQQILRVNEPGAFDGFLVHAWTYGPAVDLRIEDLGGRALFDGAVALGGPPTGSRAPFVEVPTLGLTIGATLADAAANELLLIAANQHGVVDRTALLPGERRRLGDTFVTLQGFSSWVTFFSRSDPGAPLLFAGAGLLTACFAVSAYLPRRRLTIAIGPQAVRLTVRGERYDDPSREVEALGRRIGLLLPSAGGGAS